MLTELMVLARLAAAWPWVGAATPPAHVLQLDRPTVIATRWSGKPVRVSIGQTLVPNCHNVDWLHGAAPDRQDNCRRLNRVEITIAGRALALSSSGYADLGGINDVVLRATPTRLFLFMRGPEGPEFYGATLEFDGRDIVRRTLDLADGGSEVTTYHAGSAAGL